MPDPRNIGSGIRRIKSGAQGSGGLRTATGAPVIPIRRKRVVSIGRHASRFYDPTTGRRVDASTRARMVVEHPGFKGTAA